MTTTYRYAWLAVLDGNGRRKLNEDLLSMDDVNPALTQSLHRAFDELALRVAVPALLPDHTVKLRGRHAVVHVVHRSLPELQGAGVNFLGS